MIENSIDWTVWHLRVALSFASFFLRSSCDINAVYGKAWTSRLLLDVGASSWSPISSPTFNRVYTHVMYLTIQVIFKIWDVLRCVKPPARIAVNKSPPLLLASASFLPGRSWTSYSSLHSGFKVYQPIAYHLMNMCTNKEMVIYIVTILKYGQRSHTVMQQHIWISIHLPSRFFSWLMLCASLLLFFLSLLSFRLAPEQMLISCGFRQETMRHESQETCSIKTTKKVSWRRCERVQFWLTVSVRVPLASSFLPFPLGTKDIKDHQRMLKYQRINAQQAWQLSDYIPVNAASRDPRLLLSQLVVLPVSDKMVAQIPC